MVFRNDYTKWRDIFIVYN